MKIIYGKKKDAFDSTVRSLNLFFRRLLEYSQDCNQQAD